MILLIRVEISQSNSPRVRFRRHDHSTNVACILVMFRAVWKQWQSEYRSSWKRWSSQGAIFRGRISFFHQKLCLILDIYVQEMIKLDVAFPKNYSFPYRIFSKRKIDGLYCKI